DDSYLVVGDARRGSFFVALVRDRALQGEPELVDESALGEHLVPFLAEGLAVHSSDAKVASVIPQAILSHPSASRLASHFRDADFAAHAKTALEPIYLRAPYITVPKARG